MAFNDALWNDYVNKRKQQVAQSNVQNQGNQLLLQRAQQAQSYAQGFFNLDNNTQAPILNALKTRAQTGDQVASDRVKAITGAFGAVAKSNDQAVQSNAQQNTLAQLKQYGPGTLQEKTAQYGMNTANIGKSLVQPAINLAQKYGTPVVNQAEQLAHLVTHPSEFKQRLDQTNQRDQIVNQIQNSPKLSDSTKRALSFLSTNEIAQVASENPQITNQSVQKSIDNIQQRKGADTTKAIGDVAQTASLFAGGTGVSKAFAEGGIKAAAGDIASTAGAGALGNVGNTLSNNPNASDSQLLRSGLTGAAFGGGTAILSAAGGTILKKIVDKVKAGKSLTNVETQVLRDHFPAQSSIPPENALTPVAKGGTIEGKGRGLTPSSTVSNANNQLLIDAQKLSTAQTDALNSILKANGKNGLEKNGTLTPVSTDELRMAATAHPEILQNSEIKNALNVAQQKTSNLLTSSPSGLAADTNGQLRSAERTTTPLTNSSEISGKAKSIRTDVSPIEQNFSTLNVNGPKPYTQKVEDVLNTTKPVGSASAAKGTLQDIKNLFTLPKETAGVQTDLRASLGELGAQKNKVALDAKPTVQFFAKQKDGQNLQFIQKIESNVKQSTPQLDALAGKFRTQFNQDYELAKALKPNVPYLDNYFAQSGIWADAGKAKDFATRFMNPTLGGAPGALEQRIFPTIYDGIKAGLKLRETNPAIIAVNNRAALLKATMAQKFIEDQTAKGVDQGVIQTVLDRYLEPGVKGQNWYQSSRDAAFAINSMQLGLSGFHFTATALNTVFSNFGNGLRALSTGHPLVAAKNLATAPIAPIIDAVQGKGLRAAEAAGDVGNKYVQLAHEANFPLYKNVLYQTSGLAKSLQDFQNGHIIKGTLTAPFRAINSAAKPLMEHWVPAIKAGAFKNGVDVELARLGKNATPEATRAAVQKVADSIDNRFGQLTQDNLFWNNKVKDISSVLMRSPGWNIGTVREIGGGLKNLASPSTYKGLVKGAGIPANSAYTLSLAAGVAMLGGTIQYSFTGVWPKKPIDYFYPRTGKIDKNGNPERVSLPTYAKDVFSFIHNPIQTVGNKLSPALELPKEIATNKDYFGNQVRNPQDSLLTQAKQTAEFAGKNLLPFSVTNSAQRVDKSGGAKAQSFFGLSPAPGYITKSPFEQNVQSALNQALGSKPLTPEDQAAISQKSAAVQAYKSGDISKIAALVHSGQLTDRQGINLISAAAGNSLSNSFDYLLKVDRPAAANLLSKASPEDIKKLGDLNKIKATLINTIVNDNAKPETIAASKQLLKELRKY